MGRSRGARVFKATIFFGALSGLAGLISGCDFTGSSKVSIPFMGALNSRNPASNGAAAGSPGNGYKSFVINFYPLARSRCASCHGGAISPPIASGDSASAYAASKSFVDFGAVAQSVLVAKSMNGHCGSAMCISDGGEFTSAIQRWWDQGEKSLSAGTAILSAERLGTLSRSPTKVLGIRLGRLFPKLDISTLTSGHGLSAQLGQADFVDRSASVRSVSALAQSALRAAVSDYCSLSDPSENQVFSTNGILLAGETLPSDPDTLAAFAAIRNVWLYPYVASSPEVQAFRLMRSKILDPAAGGTRAEADRTTCMAALLAPQFWLGNPDPSDVIRRLALDLAYRPPNFADFKSFKNGTLTLDRYVTNLQSEGGYLEAVTDWAWEWMGFRSFTIPSASGTDRALLYSGRYFNAGDFRPMRNSGTMNGANGISGQEFEIRNDPTVAVQPNAPVGFGKDYLVHGDQNAGAYTDSEYCVGGSTITPQAFEPRTDNIAWSQFNPVVNDFETIGYFSKDVDGIWTMHGGSITLGNGTQLATQLTDLTTALSNAELDPAKKIYTYSSDSRLSLAKTPLSPVASFRAGQRRMIRSYQGVPQTGYSQVKTFYTNTPVYACNDLTRFIATCNYRPLPLPSGQNPFYDTVTDKREFPYILNGNTDRVAISKPGNVTTDHGAQWKDLLAHPFILDAYSCGTAHPDAATETLAYPKTPPYNDIAMNAWIAKYPSESHPEFKAIVEASKDMEQEPTMLIRDIVQNNLDFRQLLTANYTWGHGALDLLYRTQAMSLPSYPPGSLLPMDAGYSVRHKIVAENFQTLSNAWLKSSWGTLVEGWSQSIYSLYWRYLGTPARFSPRPMSGVLTQAAFLMPQEVKIRSHAARIFRTFTCGDVSDFTPTQSQRAIHELFIPRKEKTGSQHVDPKQNCYACHINMDPLASALSKGFLEVAKDESGNDINSGAELLIADGEIRSYDRGDGGFTYGVRGHAEEASDGALLGQPVHGVRDVGRVLADSPQFAACTAKQAFLSIFGRAPEGADEQAFIQKLGSDFSTSYRYNYNQLVRAIVMSPFYQGVN